ncbi:hypothetical protein F5144DRAFT_374474 [Chaetomium tenue]|uniref:Uncharacterized protein n=1 Tax=Chaetomium tenue TaxID=1854479 RepID=A0ACB7P1U9_9PEZI|nr:hypothetical protein F5144DRAFT_374474 [Chaetomium globosum]
MSLSMPIDAAELRRRWSDKTTAVFSNSDRYDSRTFPAETFEREFDFKSCDNIVFMNGVRTGRPEDVILLTKGSGHMSLPANVQVIVSGGFAKCNSERSVTDGSTVIGAGARAPPPSRVEGAYAHSSADSGYSGSVRGNTVDSYRMSPPRDAAAFMRGGPVASSYMSAADIPLPRSTAGAGAGSSEWEVVGELEGFQDRTRDDCSIAPSESISSVGSRGNGGFTRRATHNF